MKNRKYVFALCCYGFIIIFLLANVIITAITKEYSLFSYICCHILGIVEAVTLILTLEEKKR